MSLNFQGLISQVSAMGSVRAAQVAGVDLAASFLPIPGARSAEAVRIETEYKQLSDDALVERAGALFVELNDSATSLASIGLQLSLIREVLERRRRVRMPLLESMENALYAIAKGLYEVIELVREK